MHSTTPGMDSRMPRSTAPLLPVMPMAVRPAPGMGWALRPRDSILSQTERTCSSVAWDCMTTSISCVLWERGFLSVLKRNEAEQIGPEAEQRIDSSDQEAGFVAEFGVWDYVEVLRASSSGALRMT